MAKDTPKKPGGSFPHLEVSEIVPRPTVDNEGSKRIVFGSGDGDIITIRTGTIVEGLDHAANGNLPDLSNYYDKSETDALLGDKEDSSEGATHALKADVDALDANDIAATASGFQKDAFSDTIAIEADVQTVGDAIAYNLELARIIAASMPTDWDPKLSIFGGTMKGDIDMDGNSILNDGTEDWMKNNYLPLSGGVSHKMIGNLEMGGQSINNLSPDDSNKSSAISFEVADARYSTIEKFDEYLPLSGGTKHKLTGDVYCAQHNIKGIGDPVDGSDAISEGYADNNYLQLNGSSVMTGDIKMATHNIKGLKDPVDGLDAVSKNFSDKRYLQVDGGNKVAGTIDMDTNKIVGVYSIKLTGPADGSETTRMLDVASGQKGKLSYNAQEKFAWGNAENWSYNDLNMEFNTIRNVATPEKDGEAANKAYVDEKHASFLRPILWKYVLDGVPNELNPGEFTTSALDNGSPADFFVYFSHLDCKNHKWFPTSYEKEFSHSVGSQLVTMRDYDECVLHGLLKKWTFNTGTNNHVELTLSDYRGNFQIKDGKHYMWIIPGYMPMCDYSVDLYNSGSH